jgi:hypothetical protein
MGDYVERCRLWATIPGSDTEKKFLFVFSIFSGFDNDIPVTIVLENSRIKKGVLWDISATLRTLLDQSLVWKLSLRVLVEILHV